MAGRVTVLPDAEMRALGFTDHREGYWYFCTPVGSDVTFNLTVEKTTGEWDETVVDEVFGQPAYYGSMIEPYRTNITKRVDAVVTRLNYAGLDVSVDHNEYKYR